MHVISMFIILLLAFTSEADTLTYSGTLGTKTIYLTFNDEEPIFGANYFNKETLFDLPLEMEFVKDSLILTSDEQSWMTDDKGYSAKEVFRLNCKVRGVLTGIWSKANQQLPVSLKLVTPTELVNKKLTTNPYLKGKSLSDYTKLKIGLFKLKSLDSIVYSNGLKLRYFEEIHSGVKLFRVDSGLVETALVNANYALEDFHIETFLEMTSCTYTPEFLFNQLEQAYSQIYINEHWLSFKTYQNWNCGFIRNNFGYYGVNYSLTDSKRIHLADLVNTKLKEEIDSPNNAFTATVVDYLSSIHPYEMKPRESESDIEYCDYSPRNLWTGSCKFVLSSTGIHFIPELSFFEFNDCPLDPEWTFVPYKVLKHFIKPDYQRLIP